MNAILPTRSVAKVWGRDALPDWIGVSASERIGEVWFEPPAELPELLVKYIFTSERLSVQTHPNDTQAEAAGYGRQGKEECWAILDAEPGASIAIGFKEPVDKATMRAAAIDGSIEDLLVWHEVEAGDFFYIPANTVHAIGSGVTLLEVQQNSDITYRLYDYGRPRELHLDHGLEVALGTPYPEDMRGRVPQSRSSLLVDGPFFKLARIAAPDASLLERFADGPLLVMPTHGSAQIADITVASGECGLAANPSSITLAADTQCFVAQPIAQL